MFPPPTGRVGPQAIGDSRYRVGRNSYAMRGISSTYTGGGLSKTAIAIHTLVGVQPYIHWWWLVKDSNSHTYTRGGLSLTYTGGGLSQIVIAIHTLVGVSALHTLVVDC